MGDDAADAGAVLPWDLARIVAEARRVVPQVAWSLEPRPDGPWLRIEAWPHVLPGDGLGGELRRFCQREGLAPRFDIVPRRIEVPLPPGVSREDLPPPRPVTDDHLRMILEEAQRLRPRGGFTWQVMRKGDVAALVLYHAPGPSEPSRWLHKRLDEFCDREGIPRASICVAHPPPSLRPEDHPVPDGWPSDEDAGPSPQAGEDDLA